MISAEDITWAQRIAARYNVTADITYLTINGLDVKLDVYQPWVTGTPRPTLMFMHGGGWMTGATKQTWALWFLPFLQLGWVIVNVDYRPSGTALAPAAVEDCLRALRWIGRNGAQFDIDAKQLVIAGLSAGGHLALTTGMIPTAMSCRDVQGGARDGSLLVSRMIPDSADLLKPAAIINWCGITDVADVATGPNQRDYAMSWIGDQPGRLNIAKWMSPLTYVCAGLPPIITIHGDDDELVPYGHAVRLHDALSVAKVPNKLVTLPGARHDALEGYMNEYPQIFSFLARAGVAMQARG